MNPANSRNFLRKAATCCKCQDGRSTKSWEDKIIQRRRSFMWRMMADDGGSWRIVTDQEDEDEDENEDDWQCTPHTLPN
jgi:hypothetical protein